MITEILTIVAESDCARGGEYRHVVQFKEIWRVDGVLVGAGARLVQAAVGLETAPPVPPWPTGQVEHFATLTFVARERDIAKGDVIAALKVSHPSHDVV